MRAFFTVTVIWVKIRETGLVLRDWVTFLKNIVGNRHQEAEEEERVCSNTQVILKSSNINNQIIYSSTQAPRP